MPRKKTERTSEFPYHVYNRLLSQKPYPARLMPLIWEAYVDALKLATWAYGARVHLFVLMSNHFHLIVETPHCNLPEVMLYTQREISKRVKELTRSQDYLFASRYKAKLITNEVQYENTYRYVAQNPVEAGLSIEPTLYEYSTLYGQYGNGRLECPLYELSVFSGLLPDCLANRLVWIGV